VPGEACEIERVPFRDANCSDAAGNQTTFMGVMDLFDNGICPGGLIEPCEVAAGAMMWDEATLSPFFTFTSGGRVYQVMNPPLSCFAVAVVRFCDQESCRCARRAC
jgi:hypothetical protein